MPFRSSTKDISFCLHEIVNIGEFYESAAYPDFDSSVTEAVLEAAGDLARDVLAPINVVGDHQGARLENGQVLIADGFSAAISAYAEGDGTAWQLTPHTVVRGCQRCLNKPVLKCSTLPIWHLHSTLP